MVSFAIFQYKNFAVKWWASSVWSLYVSTVLYRNSVIFHYSLNFIRKLFSCECCVFAKNKMWIIISKKIDRAIQKERTWHNTKLEAVQASNEELYNADR